MSLMKIANSTKKQKQKKTKKTQKKNSTRDSVA